MSSDAKFQAEYLPYLPEELREQIMVINFTAHFYKHTLVIACFFVSHYLQNLDTATLIIEKQVIEKQNTQLNDFLNSQQNAIMMFGLTKLDGTPMGID